jgi:hypothetical protein
MSENISQAKVKAYCFKVPKHLGERAIKVASRLNLLERNLKVHRIENYVSSYHLRGNRQESRLANLRRK